MPLPPHRLCGRRGVADGRPRDGRGCSALNAAALGRPRLRCAGPGRL